MTTELKKDIAKLYGNTKARLLRDLREIQRSNVYGIAAVPLENDLYEWHVNLLGPKSSPHHGACLHLSIHFPPDYPTYPPKVQMYTGITHCHAFCGWICLDLLETHYSEENYSGWSSSYTVLRFVVDLIF